jgi:aspartyl-tRNA synthetase
MHEQGFMEIQTPILTASSPEGARDYLVPSRLHPGKFYALPQAPQMFKQLLMVGGFDKYFQIAPCFRDEAGRSDRSPGEFYQLDFEMAFATQEDVFNAIEPVLYKTFVRHGSHKKITDEPFPRITFTTAMLTYGSDKPDLRNPLQIEDVSGLFVGMPIEAQEGEIIYGLRAEQMSRGEANKIAGTSRFTNIGNETIFWMKAPRGREVVGLTAPQLSALKALGPVRDAIGQRQNLIDDSVWAFCWIVDFPMYERGEDGKIEFSHNPFSMPQGGWRRWRGSTRPKSSPTNMTSSATASSLSSWRDPQPLAGSNVQGVRDRRLHAGARRSALLRHDQRVQVRRSAARRLGSRCGSHRHAAR